MSNSDVEYYRKRAIAERALARTSQRNVALIHAELARQYEALVNQAKLRPTLRMIFPAGTWAQSANVESMTS